MMDLYNLRRTSMKLTIFIVFSFVVYYSHTNQWVSKVSERINNNAKQRKPLIFIGGHASSGTGLMRVILDAHPQIRCGAESLVVKRILNTFSGISSQERYSYIHAGVSDAVLDKALSAFIIEVIDHMGPEADYLCHKDPWTYLHLSHLGRLFPEAKFILMVRDGRATIASSISRNLGSWREHNTQKEALVYWDKVLTQMLLDCQAMGRHRCHTVRYERLTMNPDGELSSLMNFLQISWHPNLLKHETMVANLTNLNKYEASTNTIKKKISTSSLGKWYGNNSKLDVKLQTHAGEYSSLLTKLGYTNIGLPPDYAKLDPTVPFISMR